MASFTDLYPERRGGIISPTTIQVTSQINSIPQPLENTCKTLLQRLTGSSGSPQHLKVTCEQHLVTNVENMPMVKTLLSALKASGCPVDLKRHLVSCFISNKKIIKTLKVCEMCQPGSEVQHAGGYDPALNQVT